MSEDFNRFLKALEENDAIKNAQKGATNLVEQVRELPNTTPPEIEDIDRLRENTEVTRNKLLDYLAGSQNSMQDAGNSSVVRQNYVEMPQEDNTNLPVVPDSQAEISEEISSMLQTREIGDEPELSSQPNNRMRDLLSQYRNISAGANQADQLKGIFQQYQERVGSMQEDRAGAQERRDKAIEALRESQRRDQIVSGLSSLGDAFSRYAAGDMASRSGVAVQPGRVNVKSDFAGAAEQQVKLAQQDLEQVQQQIDRMDITPYQKAQLTYMAQNADTKAELDAISTEMKALQAEDALDFRRESLEKTLDVRKDVAEMRLLEQQMRQKNLSEREQKKLENKLNKRKVDLTQSLRKEATGGANKDLFKSYKNAQTVKQTFDKFLENPNGFTDFGMLMQGLKVLQGDDSVIREAELRLGKNATSLINKVANQYDSLKSGKQLQPEQRQQITEVVGAMIESAETTYKSSIDQIITQARDLELPLNQIVDKNFQEEVSSKEIRRPPYGESVERNGKVYKWNSQTKKYHPID